MIANLTPAQKEDMVTSLAALLLHDAGKEITVRETCTAQHT